ncbi:Thioredoxin superfamily protein [Perilla frutescens var. frutescens]|nr:Thioredoxin superfamily protein [Perilla frutescens var. frutescens]
MDFKKSTYIGFVTLSCLFWAIVSQSSIPSAADGFWYGEETTAEGKVSIEAFFDPVCPDSRDSWPPLKRVVDEYASRVRLVVHTFPLPYHDNAFGTSRALHITNKLKTSATYHVLEAFFHHQEQFYGKATFNKSRAVVVDQIVDFTAKLLGSSYHSAIKSGFNDTSTDHATRVAFKYGCIRGVYGTPFFFVNGFPLPDAGSALDYEGWRKVIDPLVGKKEEVIHSL